ncbi:MAG TPA: ATP-binding protein [Myxococcaceae bacterium]|nr:ATP-binding protein [Myxococcaceae bacterium]
MDPIRNPFAPGAGTQPPELAGRERLIEDARITLERTKQGRAAKSQLLLGLRGVGKTVLLNRLARLAQETAFETVVIEAPEDQALAALLVPRLRSLLFKMGSSAKAADLAKRALGVLRAFAKAFKVKVGDVEFTVDAQIGTADSGDLEADLPELLIEVTRATRSSGTALALFLDEVQYLSAADLTALITAVHKLGQQELPFAMFGAGLPQLAALAGNAKSYSERLFAYPEVGALGEEFAIEAIRAPVLREGVDIEQEALVRIATKTKGYPYFLQEWGKHAWNAASGSPIKASDVEVASVQALAELDKGFFRVRLDRLTPREKTYMRAMAHLGPGPHRSGDIAKALRRKVSAVAPLRNGLLKKGMIYSPAHGDTAFTVPMFDEFMRRSMPNWSPKAAGRRGK